MKKIILIIIAVLVIIFLVWKVVGRTPPATTDNETLKIGVIMPMTGVAANYGEHQFNAIRMAVDELNAKNGSTHKRMEVILEDNATDPKKEISALQKLTDVDHVPVVIGSVWDIMANAIMPILENKQVTLISPTASPDILEKANKYFFTTIAPVSTHQPVVEKYLKNESGKKVALIYVAGGWGIANRNLYRKAIEATGKTLVSEAELTKFDGNDVQREITLLKSIRPDIILAAVNFMDAKQLVEKNKILGLNSKIFGHDNILVSYITQGIDKEALKGTVVYRLAAPDSTFAEKYKNLYGKEPANDADKAYDAVYVIAKAIELSNDSSAVGVLSGLKKVDTIEGASGPIDYRTTNWPTTDTAHLEMFNGTEFVPYLNN
jgi:branched-chain amino acid transport system substrate-binding protein